MSDEQINAMLLAMTFTNIKFYQVIDEDLIPIKCIQLSYLEKDAEEPEPVAWLGGSYNGKYSALWCVDINEITTIPENIMIWPKL